MLCCFPPVVSIAAHRLSQLLSSSQLFRCCLLGQQEWIFPLVAECSAKEKTWRSPLAPGNSQFSLLWCGRITLFLFTAEIGDFEESKCRSHLLNNNYIPDQMPLIDKIMDFHSRHMWVSWSILMLEKGFYLMQAHFSLRSLMQNIFIPINTRVVLFYFMNNAASKINP